MSAMKEWNDIFTVKENLKQILVRELLGLFDMRVEEKAAGYLDGPNGSVYRSYTCRAAFEQIKKARAEILKLMVHCSNLGPIHKMILTFEKEQGRIMDILYNVPKDVTLKCLRKDYVEVSELIDNIFDALDDVFEDMKAEAGE